MQKFLNIIHITSDYSPHALWGMGVYVETLQNGFSTMCKDIDSCVATASKSRMQSGVCITTTSDDDIRYLCKDKTAIFDNYSSYLLWQEKLGDAIIEYLRTNASAHTILHSNNWMSWITAKKVSKATGIPIVSSVHFLQRQYETMIKNPIPSFHHEIIQIENEMLAESAGIICFSAESKRTIGELYGIERDDISIIPHTSKIHDDKKTELLPTHNILFLGRLTRDKGVLTVIETVMNIREQHPHVHLHIIGDGELYEEVHSRNLSFVTLHGYIDDPYKIKEIAEQCSFSLLFTTSDVFPISILDSMACGCIPVLPDSTNVAIMFENNVSGLRIPGDIKREATRIIAELLNDNKRVMQMRRNSREYYQAQYSISTMLNLTRKVYEKALKNI